MSATPSEARWAWRTFTYVTLGLYAAFSVALARAAG